MITRKIVFVVGAGGSCAYGFPSGGDLLKTARSKASLNPLEPYHAPANIRTLHHAVTSCQDLSLDALLEHRSDISEIGRAYIAHSILTAERQACPERASVSGDWLAYLFSEMANGCHNVNAFDKNAISFITYNYDRLIEQRISEGAATRFIVPPTRAPISYYWNNQRVIHLHGSLGPIDTTPFGADPTLRRDDGFSYVEHSAQAIEVVHQARPDSVEFKHAASVLAEAEVVFFLGFSFGRTNVDRLPLHRIPKTAKVVCSRYGMTNAETRMNILQPFKKNDIPEPILCGSESDCLQTLRDHVDLFVDRYG